MTTAVGPANHSAYTIIFRVRHIARHATVLNSGIIIASDATHVGRGDGVIMLRTDIGTHPAVPDGGFVGSINVPASDTAYVFF